MNLAAQINKSLSVILPVYNSHSFIADSLEKLDNYLNQHLPQTEIIVVNDGSSDDTQKILATCQIKRLKVINLPRNLGKFGALQQGFLSSHSEVRLFIDCDLPYELSIIKYAYQQICSGLHLAIGDRTLLESSSIVKRTIIRKIFSKIFSSLTRLILAGGIFDTQCGFKAFDGQVAQELFKSIKSYDFTGDVEIIYLSLKYNLLIRRIPVKFINDAQSTIHPLRDSLRMLRQLILIPFRWYSGQYKNPALIKLSTQSY